MATTDNSSTNWLDEIALPHRLALTVYLTSAQMSKLKQLAAQVNESSREFGASLGLETTEITPEDHAAQLLVDALNNA